MNLISYLEWRGDISIARLPLCEADYAVIGCCSYLPFDGIVPSDFEDGSISLWNAVSTVREMVGLENSERSYHYREDEEMTQMLLTCPRFTSLGLTGFRNIIDEEKEEQFCALTMLLPGKQCIVVFRGTDKTVTGWKEDFNMLYLESVPSQDDALAYLTEVASHTSGDIYVCGHSKGGNLAMYASAYCSDEVKCRIKQIVNLDGPGFEKEKAAGPDMASVKDRLYSFIPQQSIVGMMLDLPEKYSVVHSNGNTFWQHSLYTWDIRRGDFIRETDVKALSKNMDTTVENWLMAMPKSKREKMVDGFWKIVIGSGVDNVDDLFTLKSTVGMLRTMGKIDDETKDILSEALGLFMKSFKNTQRENRELKRESRRLKLEKDKNAD